MCIIAITWLLRLLALSPTPLQILGFPSGSVVKSLPVSARDTVDVGSILGSGTSPGGGNGTPLQYSCLENLVDRGACRATVHHVAKSDTTEHTCTESIIDVLKMPVSSWFGGKIRPTNAFNKYHVI